VSAAEGRREPESDVAGEVIPGADSAVDGATMLGQIIFERVW
jgi:hypothetical protein